MKFLLPLIVLALAVAACGSGDDAEPAAQPPPAAGLAAGPGISIDEAIAMTSDEPLLVNGYLVARSGDPVRLCTSLPESYPPGCGGPSLVVEGLDLKAVQGLRRDAGAAWTENYVQLLGVVKDGKITVSETAIA